MGMWMIGLYFLTVMMLYKSVEQDDTPFEGSEDELKFLRSR